MLEYIHRLVMYIYLIVYTSLDLLAYLNYFCLTCHLAVKVGRIGHKSVVVYSLRYLQLGLLKTMKQRNIGSIEYIHRIIIE